MKKYGIILCGLKDFMFKFVKAKSCIIILFSCVFMAFGIYNVHSLSGVTEGGVLGATLLFDHWFDLSPAISTVVLNAICYFIGWKILGKEFLFYSAIGTVFYSASYAVFEVVGPVFPEISNMPLVASLVGAVFVGVGAGFCVRECCALGGDDALAMAFSKTTKVRIQWLYLISDITILSLSLTYIPLLRIIYSVLTVVLSGQIIGFIDKIGKKEDSKINEK